MSLRVLLACEGGAGRGHVSTLRSIARAYEGVAICDAALNHLEHAADLVPHCDLVFPGSALISDRKRRHSGQDEPICSWADYLGDLGFADPEFLVGRIEWWITTLRARVSNFVVADFAPVATLAARVLGIRSAIIGPGYFAPPPGLEQFPILDPKNGVSHYEESDILLAVNAALAHFGTAPLQRLSDIYQCEVHLPQTIAALDAYGGQREVPYLAPVNGAVPGVGTGDEIFGYFSTDEDTDDALIEALRRLGPKLRLHMPRLSVEQSAALRQAGVKLTDGPIPLEAIAAKTRLALNAGQHGTLTMAMAMGLPQLAIPRHLEHAYHAQKARALGCVSIVDRAERDPDAIVSGIMAAYENHDQRARARDVAGEYGDQLCGPLLETLRARLLPALLG